MKSRLARKIRRLEDKRDDLEHDVHKWGWSWSPSKKRKAYEKVDALSERLEQLEAALPKEP